MVLHEHIHQAFAAAGGYLGTEALEARLTPHGLASRKIAELTSSLL